MMMTGATDRENAVLQILEDLGVAYERIEIDPEYADTAAFCEHYDYPLERSANAIVVATKRGEKRYAACLALATTRLDVNHTVRRLMDGKRLSFASSHDAIAVTGMEIGGVTPLNLPDDLPLFVDRAVMDLDWIIVGSGSRNSKIKLSPAIFEKIPSASIIDGLAAVPDPR